MTNTQKFELIRVLSALPPDKLDEVKDFAVFLHERYSKSQTIDESDEWSNEDLSDFSLASFEYFEQTEQESEAAK